MRLSRSAKNVIKIAGAAVLWMIIWQAAASSANNRLLIPIPTPVSTTRALFRLAGESSFWLSIGDSLVRIGAGFLLALIFGTLCALLSFRSETFRILTAPIVGVIRSIPVATFTILIFLWISRDRIPSSVVFLTVFPMIWANIESGLRSYGTELVEMAQVFGMPRGRIVREIVIPGLRPYFLSATASGLGFAWKSGVAAEIICRTSVSLGNLLWEGKSAVEYDEVFAVTFVIILLSAILQAAARLLIKEARKRGRA